MSKDAANQYTLVENIYIGSHVEIFKSIRDTDQQKVILKLLRSEHATSQDLARLQHEYNLFKQLNLPGLIHMHELTMHGTRPALVLEDMGGQSLDIFLGKQALSLDNFFHVALQLVDIIGTLHQHQVIHKDIKPANIIMEPNTLTIKLTDLSISSQLSMERLEAIHPKMLEGTLAYMAPEQTGRMNRPLDYRVDFYALGITFFEMLTGKLPFEADDTLGLVHCHLAKAPPLVTDINPQIPSMVAAIINKLLAKMPEDRYQSTIGIKADLAECALQWREKKSINPFVLAQKDIQEHLQVSQKLYGRENQIAELLAAYDRVREGQTELLLVKGYSGVGKSSLVREVQKPIVQSHGYYIQGKYDQLQRSTPYSAIITAFQELSKQILAESETILNQIKRELLKALGNNGQVIIDVIPEIELIIGKQPAVPGLNPSESQNRFNMVFQSFVQVFIKHNHALVVFLDDLQWADTASLKLMETLLTDPNMHRLLLIGAYRDNEVDESHVLYGWLQQWHKKNIAIHTLNLEPLAQAEIEQLLADTLSTTVAKVAPLAVCVDAKTQGNPYFIDEFLKNLYQEHALTFSYEQQQWQWDVNKIQQQSMMENVIDLLSSKIHRLNTPTQYILQLAACIGYRFSLQTLATISGESFSTVAKLLWEAIQANLITALEESYKTTALIEGNVIVINNVIQEELHYQFIHDKIQQTAYELIPEETKQELHLKIGRLLIKDNDNKADDKNIFNIIQHFNKSIDLVTDPQEVLTLAQINLVAAEKAKSSIAYQTALSYAQAGIKLLGNNAWEIHHDLTYKLYKAQVECEYLLGMADEAEQHFNLLIEHADSVYAKADIYTTQLILYSSMSQHKRALQVGVMALKLLGVHIPLEPSMLDLLKDIITIEMRLKFKNLSTFDQQMSQVTEGKSVLIDRLFMEMGPSSYMSNPNLLGLTACRRVSLSLANGYYSSFSITAYMSYSLIRLSKLGKYKSTLSIIEFTGKMIKKCSYLPAVSRYYSTMTAWFAHWYFPYEKCVEYSHTAFQYAIDAGDLLFVGYIKGNYMGLLYTMGSSLNEVAEANISALKVVEGIKDHAFRQCIIVMANITKQLISNELIKAGNDHVIEGIEVQAETKIGQWAMQIYASSFYFILGNFSRAYDYAEEAYKIRDSALGNVLNQELYFLYTLSISQLYDSATKNQQRHYKKIFNELFKVLKHWMRECPVNIEHKYYLVAAEKARLQGDIAKASQLYDQGIQYAQDHKFISYVAMGNEIAARFYLGLKQLNSARHYMTDAYYAYKNWGALVKCRQMESEYPHWFIASNVNETITSSRLSTISSTSSTTIQSIDTTAILKSAQIISSEIHFDKLLKKLLTVMLEDAGAQRGVLLLKKNEEWWVEAEKTANLEKINIAQLETLSAREDLPLTLISYVQRTKKPVVIREANTTDLANTDPYLKRVKLQSLVLMPLFHQGQLKRILYLENHLTSQAFLPEHLESLQLLASQATISLENAQLYYQATHDPLTGLANRNLLYQMFQSTVSRNEQEQKQIAVLFLDLDYFKTINDTLGHEIGDKLLIYLSEQLRLCLPEHGLAARLGGDEFVMMLTDVEKSVDVRAVAERFYQSLKGPVILSGHELRISSSMGISLYPKDGKDIQTLLKVADMALYRAKENGKNQYQFYSLAIHEQSKKAHDLETGLRQAMEHQEFCLYYQPIFNTQTGNVASMEVLLRWQHPEKGLLDAKHFIRALENGPLLIPASEWILKTACTQAKDWQMRGLLEAPVAVNISAIHFKKQALSKFIAEILQELDLDPKYLELEFTETAFLEENSKVLAEINSLFDLGIKLVIDDFGTGYSSLSYLKRLPVSKLKIDQSFIQKSQDNIQDQAIIKAIIAMAHQLNLKVIAEGVEQEAQLTFLREYKADAVQGYYCSYPLSTKALEELLVKERERKDKMQ